MKSFPYMIASIVVALSVGIVSAESNDSKLPTEDDYYQITTFELPEGEVVEACGFQQMGDGRLAVCTRRGDIFMISDPLADKVTADQVTLYASGLHETLSLAERDGWLYAVQRPEVTRMKDTDSDGQADVFETYADGWGINGDYHEYAFGSKFDDAGNLYITLCLTGSFSSESAFRGWAMKIDPTGKVTPYASGVRSPGGMGFDAHGNLFYTDNQGPWNGTCGLKLLRQGAFEGHPGGFEWYKDAPEMGPKPTEPVSGSRIHIETTKIPQLIPTAVMFPYDKLGKSASGIACDTTGGKFGPFENQLFVADQTQSRLMRVDLEEVDGLWQGACFPFVKGFASGNVGVQIDESGCVFVGGTNRGWGSVGPKPFAVQRLNWTGKVPFEIKTMRLQDDGFKLTFTQPVDAGSASTIPSYDLSTYTYEYRSEYGSPEVDATTPTIKQAIVSEDGLSVQLIVDGLQLGHVHELKSSGVRNREGHPLLHPDAYYTINRMR